MKKRLFLIIFALLMSFSLTACKGERIKWSDMRLGSVLPEPDSGRGKLYQNSDEELSVYFYNISSGNYNAYVSECKDNGFTIEPEDKYGDYESYNSDGYKLQLSFNKKRKEMSIKLKAPMEMSDIEWPSGIAGKLLPAPKSLKGNISYEHDDSFCVYIGNMTKEDMGDYIKICSDAGFNVDYDKSDKYYRAKNNYGFKVSLSYVGNNVIKIIVDHEEDIDIPEATSAVTEVPTTESVNRTETVTETVTSDTTVDISGEVNPEFKASLDTYEAFFDEYIAFMEKYKNADQTDLMNMLNDYNNYLQRYTEAVNALNSVDQSSLSPADYAYYTEVMMRISQKLLSVSQ